MYCKKCGNEIKEGTEFCTNCGNKINKSTDNSNINDFEDTIKETNKNGQFSILNRVFISMIIIVAVIIAISIFVMMVNSESSLSNVDSSVNIKEETKEEKQNRLKQEQENAKITSTIKKFAESIRAQENGSVKYSTYYKYGVSSRGEQVYKIKYITSQDGLYYYQLVSLDSDNEKVIESTRLFVFSDYVSGEDLELEYAYEEKWK